MHSIKTRITRRKWKEKGRGSCLSNLILIKLIKPVDSSKCKMAFLNPWSIANKTTSIFDFIESNKLDLLAVSESWLRGDGSVRPQRMTKHEMIPLSHQILHIPRPGDRKGGGIALLFKKAFQAKVLDYTKESTEQLEYLVTKIVINKTSVRLLIVYRPNPTPANNLNVKLFWKDFEKLISKHASCAEEVIVTGDLNFHLEIKDHANTLQLNCLLDEYGLKQTISEPTHVAGHTLDVLIIKCESELVTNMYVSDPCLSNEQGKVIKDHFALHWTFIAEKPKPISKTISYRDLNGINYDTVKDDLSRTELIMVDSTDARTAEELTQLYNNTLKVVLDKHAPLKTRTILVREDTPWFNAKITESKRLRRAAERKMIRTGSLIDKHLYREQCNKTNKLLIKVKSEFYSSQVAACKRDQKTLYKITNSWMGSSAKNILPSRDSDKELADKIVTFFAEKVKGIRLDLIDGLQPNNPFLSVMSSVDPLPSQILKEFSQVSESEMKEMILASKLKQCELDPAPTVFVKSVVDILAKPISIIINKSLSTGIVPTTLKEALIRPTLKKTELDPEEICNYRPVSNLPFLSKLLEKSVNTRLDHHLEFNHLLSKFQSVYRKHHSTKTVLLKVQNDILEALDDGFGTILVLLDISAAFDVVEHPRLLERHKKYFGLTDTALSWMSSYLNGRTQCVVVGNERSYIMKAEHGFPQGSVLGGRKFTMYSTPLSNIIVHHDVEHECYADDTQKYLLFKLKDKDSLKSAITQLERCLQQVSYWMSANMLMLNNDKTKLIVFAPKHFRSDLSDVTVQVESFVVKQSDEVKNLGVIMDSSLTMMKQINSVTKSCYYHIRRIARIRKYLTEDATKSLVHAYITSRLDYCNSLLSLLPAYVIRKLQRVQNSAARLVKKIPRRASITAHRKYLHWLPIIERVKFKVLLMVYKCLNNLAPYYLKTMLKVYNPPRRLRSTSQKLLTVKRSKTNFGTRAFSRYGPTLWNKLPFNIKSANTLEQFKTLVKTYLFENAYRHG